MVETQPGRSIVRPILFCLAFSIHSIAGIAQKHGQALIDSLNSRLINTRQDTDRVKLLLAISSEYELFNPDKGLDFAKQGLRLAKTLSSPRFEAKGLRQKGSIHFRQSNLDSAFVCFTEALKISNNLSDSAGISNAYGDLGRVYQYKVESSTALKYQLQALKIAESINDSALIAKHLGGVGYAYFMLENRELALKYLLRSLGAYERLKNERGVGSQVWMVGLVYKYNGDYGKAIEHFFRAINILEKQDAKITVSNCYVSLGEAYIDRGEIEKAMQYLGLALKIKKEVGNRAEIARCLSSISDVYAMQNDFDKAIDFGNQAMSIIDTAADAFGVAKIAGGLANLYADMKKYDESLVYYKKAMRAAEQTKNNTYLGTNAINLSTIYIELEREALEKGNTGTTPGDIARRGFLKEAIHYCNIGVSLGAEANNSYLLMAGFEILADAYEMSGKHKDALAAYKNFVQYKDSIFNKATTDKIARAEVKVEYEKKHLADSLKTIEVRKVSALEVKAQRNYMWGGGGFATLVFVLSVASIRKSKTLSLEKLRNKISRDLHDEVGSTLSSISLMNELARKDNGEDDIRDQISNSLKSAQDAMSEIVWLLNPKNDLLDNFILRMVEVATEMLELKDIRYKLDIPENFSGRNISMDKRREIYLVFKECLNNIIKYSGCTEVEIVVRHTQRQLTLTVSDNGSGFDGEVKGSGNGLRNMRERAATLKGTLNLVTAPGCGTRIDLVVPLAQTFSEKWAVQLSGKS